MSQKSQAIAHAGSKAVLSYADQAELVSREAMSIHTNGQAFYIQDTGLWYKKVASTSATGNINGIFEPFTFSVRTDADYRISPWASGETYRNDDIVSYNGQLYVANKAINNSASNPTAATADWDPLFNQTANMVPDDMEYDNTFTYSMNDVPAFDDGFLVVSKTGSNVGVDPGQGTAAAWTNVVIDRFASGTRREIVTSYFDHETVWTRTYDRNFVDAGAQILTDTSSTYNFRRINSTNWDYYDPWATTSLNTMLGTTGTNTTRAEQHVMMVSSLPMFKRTDGIQFDGGSTTPTIYQYAYNGTTPADVVYTGPDGVTHTLTGTNTYTGFTEAEGLINFFGTNIYTFWSPVQNLENNGVGTAPAANIALQNTTAGSTSAFDVEDTNLLDTNYTIRWSTNWNKVIIGPPGVTV